MNVLYRHFVEQVKREEVEKYNKKHRDYLIRAGLIQDNGAGRNRNEENRGYQVNVQAINQGVVQTAQKEEVPIKKARRQRQFDRPNKAQANTSRDMQQSKFENQQYQRPIDNTSGYQGAYSQNLHQEERPLKPSTISYQQPPYLAPPGNTYGQIPQNTRNFNDIPTKRIPIPSPREERPIVQKQPDVKQIEQYQEVELFECSQGCGRKFAAKALAKHEKACQKVFQQKRKPFQVMKTNQEAEKLKNKTGNPKAKEAEKKKKEKKDWKVESDNFRNMLKQGRGEKTEEIVDQRIQCPCCGRKFAEQSAQRHIQFCKNKAKSKK